MLSWHVQNFNYLGDFNKDKGKANIDEIWIMSSLRVVKWIPDSVCKSNVI